MIIMSNKGITSVFFVFLYIKEIWFEEKISSLISIIDESMLTFGDFIAAFLNFAR